jgi:integrase/recombinase XerD
MKSGTSGGSSGSKEPPRSFRLEQFHDYLTFERGLSERTVTAYQRDLTRWIEVMGERGVSDPGAVSVQALREWVFTLKESGLAATSIRRAQSAVRTYFGFLLAEGALESDPTDRLDSPKVERKLPEFLSRDEIDRVLDAPDPGRRPRERAR